MVDNVKTQCSTTGEQDTNPAVDIIIVSVADGIDCYPQTDKAETFFIEAGYGRDYGSNSYPFSGLMFLPQEFASAGLSYRYSPHTVLGTPSETPNTESSPNTNTTAADPEPGR